MIPVDDLSVRALGPADAEVYRALRLLALESEPAAFSSDFATAQAHDLSWFEERLSLPPPSAMFGAFLSDQLAGTVGLVVGDNPKRLHRGLVVGMFVTSRARGRGIGYRLLGTLLDHAAGYVDVLDLAVGTGNQPAKALYTRLGFETYGVVRDAMRIDGQSVDEALMTLDLARSETPFRPLTA